MKENTKFILVSILLLIGLQTIYSNLVHNVYGSQPLDPTNTTQLEFEWTRNWFDKYVFFAYTHFRGDQGSLSIAGGAYSYDEEEYDTFTLQMDGNGNFHNYAEWDDPVNISQELPVDMHVEDQFVYTCGLAYNFSSVLIKWNKISSTPVWTEKTHKEGYGNLNEVTAFGDSIYTLGTYYLPNHMGAYNQLIKWNSDGSKAWNKTVYHIVDFYEEVLHIGNESDGVPTVLSADENGVSVGFTSSSTYNDTLYCDTTLYRLDHDGNELWMKETDDRITSAWEDDEAIYTKHWHGHFEYPKFIVKWNHDGTIAWNKSIHTTSAPWYLDVSVYNSSLFQIQWQSEPEDIVTISRWNGTSGAFIRSQNITGIPLYSNLYVWQSDVYLFGTSMGGIRVTKLKSVPVPDGPNLIPGYPVHLMSGGLIIGVCISLGYYRRKQKSSP